MGEEHVTREVMRLHSNEGVVRCKGHDYASSGQVSWFSIRVENVWKLKTYTYGIEAPSFLEKLRQRYETATEPRSLGTVQRSTTLAH